MIKYIENMTQVVAQEIPDEFSLAFNLSRCQNNCKGCHSAFLKKDIGNELTLEVIEDKIKHTFAPIGCILFMGEGNDIDGLLELAKKVKESTGLKIAVYSGRESVEDEYYKVFDYVKVGPYREEFGPLNKETTNQRLYDTSGGGKVDITYKFWRNNA